jgi:phage terminase large subunit
VEGTTVKIDNRTLYEALPDLWLRRMSGEIALEKQCEIMRAVGRYPRVAVASANSCGKTFIAARIAVWFLCMYARSIVIITAPTDRQVLEVLWREMRAFKAKAEARGNPIGGKMLLTGKWEFAQDHFAIAFSTNDNDPAKFQGFHAPHILVIADEAAGISEQIFEGITAVLKGAHTRLLAIGNPTTLEGWFYEAFRSPGWWSTHISAFDTPNVREGRIVVPGLITAQDIEQARTDYGEGSPMWQARIEGRFPAQLEDTMIALDWIEKAAQLQPPEQGEVVVGADIARFGKDSTVFVARHGMNLFAAEEYNQIDTMQASGLLARFCKKVRADRVQVDVVGLGAAVVDRLREVVGKLDLDVELVEMGAGEKAHDDKNYTNASAEWYAVLALLLYEGRAGGTIFGNKRLISDLSSRKRRMRSDGRWELEPKQEIHKRGGRSPDWGDAVAMCFAPPPRNVVAEWIEFELKRQAVHNPTEATPARHVLNRQTQAIELMPRAKAAPVTRDQPETSGRKTLIGIYQETSNRFSFASFSRAKDPCKACGNPVGGTRIEDGVDVWHPDCSKRW